MRTIRLAVAAVAALLMLGGLGAAAAGAQTPDYPVTPPTDGGVLPDVLTPETPPAEVVPLSPQPSVRANVGGLPVTGGDALGLALIGAGAIGAGVVLVRARRLAS